MKAVLVIDNVDCCGRCPLLDRCYPFSCIYTGKVIHTDALCSHREKDCPLRPLPTKKQEEKRWYSEDYSIGWNDCLDAITGETE